MPFYPQSTNPGSFCYFLPFTTRVKIRFVSGYSGLYAQTVSESSDNSRKKTGRGSGEGSKSKAAKSRRRAAGKLKIGNHWNAISIIALSQHSPLKAIAELVENAIDAGAMHVSVTKGRSGGKLYLRVTDDGRGIKHDSDGRPDFRFVATHICDSIKKKLKADGDSSVQGEFGIGLLGFWTLGESMTLSCADREGTLWEMRMVKGQSDYHIEKRRVLMTASGTEVVIHDLLSGPAQLTGEKVAGYLSSELGERIRSTGVEVTVRDRVSRFEAVVTPREFTGTLLEFPDEVAASIPDSVKVEIYFQNRSRKNRVALYKSGTRVLEDISQLEGFDVAPWNCGMFEGRVDAQGLNLNPASRLGVVQDDMVAYLKSDLQAVESALVDFLQLQEEQAAERSSIELKRQVQSAMREALLALNANGIHWGFGDHSGRDQSIASSSAENAVDSCEEEDGQKLFFEIAGPLHTATITPASVAMQAYSEQEFKVIARDRQKRQIDDPGHVNWVVLEGPVSILDASADRVTIEASGNSGLARIQATVSQRETTRYAEALITVTQSVDYVEPVTMLEDRDIEIPDFQLEDKPAELWRSRFSRSTRVVYINAGHRDYFFASSTRQSLLRYIARLYCKELVLLHSENKSPAEILEQLTQIEMYMESGLRGR